MNGRLLRLANRDWSAVAPYWIAGWLIGAAFCVLAQPFDTQDMRLFARTAYRLMVNGLSLLIMFGVLHTLYQNCPTQTVCKTTDPIGSRVQACSQSMPT